MNEWSADSINRSSCYKVSTLHNVIGQTTELDSFSRGSLSSLPSIELNVSWCWEQPCVHAMFWHVSKWMIHILLHPKLSSDKLSNIPCSVTVCHELVSVDTRSHGVCCTKICAVNSWMWLKSHDHYKNEKISHSLPQNIKSMHHYLVTVIYVRCYCIKLTSGNFLCFKYSFTAGSKYFA